MRVTSPRESVYRDAAFRRHVDLLQEAYRAHGLRFPSDGPSGENMPRWKEFATPAGRVDLLIEDCGNVFVFEFKRDRGDECAVAQALRYTGCLQALLTEHGFENRVFACVVAPRFSAGAVFAASVNRCAALIQGSPPFGELRFEISDLSMLRSPSVVAELIRIVASNEDLRQP